MLKKLFVLFFVIGLIPFISFSQYPPLGINCGTVLTGASGTVDVPITAGSNFQNITQFSGTFTYNPAVISWNSMQNWSLTNLPGAVFTNTTPGIVTFTWSSLISVGPTVASGGLLFNLRFNVIGSIGQSSPIGFTNSPQWLNWQNGFGWAGTNFSITDGLVSIGCLGPNTSFNAVDNFYYYNFINGSTGATSWSWDFGDGSPLVTTQSASHTFATAGSYNVCLTATNSCGSNTYCDSVHVCPNIPVSSYTNTSNGLNGVFTNSSTGTPATYTWDFGDGTTGTNSGTFLHTFPSPGTYNVCLTATNGCGIDTYCQQVVITCPAPTSSWTSTNTNYNYSFTSTATGGINWLWNFGDGTTSTVPNATHTYTANGTYTICLIVSNSCGADTSCQTITVSCPTPGAAYTFTTNNLAATFTDATPTTPTSRLWDFGDGATSTVQSPVHTYTATGTYTVCLTTTNACGSDSTCNSVLIWVADLENLDNSNFEIYPNPAQNFIQINSLENSPFSASFFNLQGQLIFETKTSNGQKIDTQGLAKGSYIVLIKNEKVTSTRKLIID